MCGIIGYFGKKNDFKKHFLKDLSEILQHRGPDAKGIFKEKNCLLIHNRLSILDLSDSGNQPMFSANGDYSMAYNGEIYNFREIKKNLGKVSWKSNADTEVILEGWAREGEDFIKKMNGMFSIAIYDRKNQDLILVRDRVGIKPLYLYRDEYQNFAFASELKALQQFDFLNWEVSKEAISLFLHLGYIPAPLSIFKNVYKIPPGTIVKVDKNFNYQEKKYWKIPSARFLIQNEKEAVEELKSLLKKSIQYRMIADVPLGIFLSGGVDSSTVAAIASEVSNHKIKTFSIGFQENKFDETPFARKVAKILDTDHQEEVLLPKEAQKLLPDITKIFDEPFADVSALPTLLVSKIAKQKVTVVLGGDGADELFWGYGVYDWAKRMSLMQSGKSVLKNIFQFRKSDSFRKGKNMMDFSQKNNLPLHLFSQEQGFFSEKELRHNLLFPFEMPVLSQISRFRYKTAQAEQAFFDLYYYLPDDLLVKIDRASMHFSLEARVPFLDHQLIEFAQKLSPSLKKRNQESKYLLKQLLYQYLPKEIFERPKWGFGIPLADWLQGSLKEWVEDILTEKNLKEANWINPQFAIHLKNQFLRGDNFLAKKVWLLLILHQFWLENKQMFH